MAFRTKIDYSSNRQIIQREQTFTTLSGASTFGLPFSGLSTGPDLNTTTVTEDLSGLSGTTFSGNNTTTIFSFADPRMNLAANAFSAITPSNFDESQNSGDIFVPFTSTMIDGNLVNLTYTGVNFTLDVETFVDLGGTYSGTIEHSEFFILSAGTLDFTERTIWIDNPEISRTDRLIISRGAAPGYILSSDSEGMASWIPTAALTAVTVDTFWTSGSSGNFSLKSVNSSTTDATGDYAVAEGFNTLASGEGAHAEGFSTTASGENSHAEGRSTTASGDYGSHAEGFSTTASGNYGHVEGYLSISSGIAAHAEGRSTTASGNYSHAEGRLTTSFGLASHAEGRETMASGIYSHAEGRLTLASGHDSHAEGSGTTASGHRSHAEGQGTTASGYISHAEGHQTLSEGHATHSEGRYTRAGLDFGAHSGGNGFDPNNNVIASGNTAFAHMRITSALGNLGVFANYSSILGGTDHNINTGAHRSAIIGGDSNVVDTNVLRSVILGGSSLSATVNDTVYVPKLNIDDAPVSVASNPVLTIDGSGNVSQQVFPSGSGGDQYWTSGSTGIGSVRTIAGIVDATGNFSTASGNYNTASGYVSSASGKYNTASGYGTHVEGVSNTASGTYGAHAEGFGNISDGFATHAEGSGNYVNGHSSHVEGRDSIASGVTSHAEGWNTTASGDYSHSEGRFTIASGNTSHAEGRDTQALGDYSHAEGDNTLASGLASHAEGEDTIASGNFSHAEGNNTLASGLYSHAEGLSTTASGFITHAEGNGTLASGQSSHAEGFGTTASGEYGAHSEGATTEALGNSSHSQGRYTLASGHYSHASGQGAFSNNRITVSGNTSFAHFRFFAPNTELGVYGDESAILGGRNQNIGVDAHRSAILAGRDNRVTDGVIRSAVIGGIGISATTNDTVYVPDLVIDGLTSVTDLQTDATGRIIDGASDISLKTNINELDSALNKIKDLRGVSFDWKAESNMGGGKYFGLIAQEVKEVIPEIVKPRVKHEDHLTLDYKALIPWLIEAVKELAEPTSPIFNEIQIQTETIASEDSDILLNFNGNHESSLGGGLVINRGVNDKTNSQFIINSEGDWVSNTYIIPHGLVIPEFTPESSSDETGKVGEITRDTDYIYVKGNDNQWMRSKLERF